MILQFSDVTNKKGIVQKIDRLCGTVNTSAGAYPLLDKTVDVNFALASYFMLAVKAAGRWQVDDTNHTDYPIIFGDIVASQQDYSFTNDENGNQILDIYKIRIKYPDGTWKTLQQRDMMEYPEDDEWLNSNTTGLPTEFELNANGIFLNCIPNYSQADSLEVYISRSGSYFDSTDTTKVAGIPDIHQEYLCLRPSYFYCLAKKLPQAAAYGIQLYGRDGKSGMEKDIQSYYSRRNRSEKPRMQAMRQDNR